MGAPLSQRLRRLLVRAILSLLFVVSPPVKRLIQRLAASPGIPVPDPCGSHWMNPPSPIAKHGSGPEVTIPEHADIVIVGSGITGTSIARTILDYDASVRGSNRPLQVVMLEARDACSGATARNGGHITPVLYHDYVSLKNQHGSEKAAQIIRFRLSHFGELLAVASEEGLLEESQCRRTRSYDVFKDQGLYNRAKALLGIYMRDLAAESSSYQVIESPEALADLQLSPSVVGCISTYGGTMHPYRLVTGILARLLRAYPSSFHLFTHTPCTAVSSSMELDSSFIIHTPRASIRTRHVIHATNGWVSHLLPGMRNKIFPFRAVMTAQQPRPGLGKLKHEWTGMRSFVFYPGKSLGTYDYLTQQLPTPSKESLSIYPPPSAELMMGGGLNGLFGYLTEIGNVDDRAWNPRVANYLSTALGNYFHVGENDQRETMISEWGGILGISTDGMPWVGRVPKSVSRRPTRRNELESNFQTSDATLAVNKNDDGILLAPPGEWIAAGYTGEGMVHAWLSGKAVAYMVLGLDHETGDGLPLSNINGWLPKCFRITGERCESTGFEGTVASFLFD